MSRHRFSAAGIALSLLVASCGIPLDDEPTVIANIDLPPALQAGSTSTTTTIPDQLTEDVTIFLVNPGDGDSRLVSVVRQVPIVESGADIERVILEQLLAGPTSEEQLDNNLTSAVVPSGDEPIRVVDIERPAEGQLVVELSEAPALEGSDRTVAFAQLVFTLTELNTVAQVRFTAVNDEGTVDDISVSTDTEEGDVRRAVGRDDYPSFSPARGPG